MEKETKYLIILFFLVFYTLLLGGIHYNVQLIFYFILLIIFIFYLNKIQLFELFRGRNLLFLLFLVSNLLFGLYVAVFEKDFQYVYSIYEKSYFISQNIRYFLYFVYYLFLIWLMKQNTIINNLKIFNYLYFIHVILGLSQHILSKFNLFQAFSQKYGYREIFIFSGHRIDGFAAEATGYAAVLIILFFCRLMYVHLLKRNVIWIEYIIFLYLLIYTFSRGAWLSLIFAIIIAKILTMKINVKIPIKKMISTTIVSLIIVTIYTFIQNNDAMASQVSEQLTNFYLSEAQDKNYTNEFYSRPRLFSLAYEAFMDSPLFGIGTGNFHKYVSWDYGVFNTWGAINDYLQIIAENGIVGIILYTSFIFYPYVWFILKKKLMYDRKIIFLVFIINLMVLFLGNSINNALNPIFWFSNSLLYYILINQKELKPITNLRGQ